jgi:hypothetical protein
MVIVAQLVEQRIVVPRVAGSSPVIHPADIAQLVEHRFGKAEVTSSILVVSSALIVQLDRALVFGTRNVGSNPAGGI